MPACRPIRTGTSALRPRRAPDRTRGSTWPSTHTMRAGILFARQRAMNTAERPWQSAWPSRSVSTAPLSGPFDVVDLLQHGVVDRFDLFPIGGRSRRSSSMTSLLSARMRWCLTSMYGLPLVYIRSLLGIFLGIFRSSVFSGGRIVLRGHFGRDDRVGRRAVVEPRHRDQHLPHFAAGQRAVRDLADFGREILVDDRHLLLGAIERHGDHRDDVAAGAVAGRDLGADAEAAGRRRAQSAEPTLGDASLEPPLRRPSTWLPHQRRAASSAASLSRVRRPREVSAATSGDRER